MVTCRAVRWNHTQSPFYAAPNVVSLWRSLKALTKHQCWRRGKPRSYKLPGPGGSKVDPGSDYVACFVSFFVASWSANYTNWPFQNKPSSNCKSRLSDLVSRFFGGPPLPEGPNPLSGASLYTPWTLFTLGLPLFSLAARGIYIGQTGRNLNYYNEKGSLLRCFAPHCSFYESNPSTM